MGSLNRKLNSSTCSSLLLWSAVLPWLLPSLRLRLMPIPLCSMELMELMELMAMASPMPDMAMVPTPMPTMERGLLMLSPRLMLTLTTMELMVLVMAMLVLAMLDMAMDTPMPMEPMPTERVLLTPSPRLMLLFSMELTDMVDTVLVMPDTAMVPTPMPTVPIPMATTERGLLMLSLRLMLMLTTMELTVLAMPDMAMLFPTSMVPTPMPTDMASKKSTTSNQSRPPSTNAEAQKQTKYKI